MLSGPEEASARPFPTVVLALSLLCSAAFLYALTLESAALGDWFERWGLVSRALLRDIREAGFGLRMLTPLTAALLHANLAHLVGNLCYLGLFGEALEVTLGSLRFGVLLLLCALAAALAHVLAQPDSFVPAIGASGAISGLLGAYLLVRRRTSLHLRWHPGGISPVAFLVLWGGFLVLAHWAASEAFASWAHLGGLAAGVALAGVLTPRSPSPEPA